MSGRRSRRAPPPPPPPPPKSWWARRWDTPAARRRTFAALFLGLAALLSALVYRLFLAPATSQPARADAVVVLGGDDLSVGRAAELAGGQPAPAAVLVLAAPDRPDSVAAQLCRAEGAVEVACIGPDDGATGPDTLREQARRAGRLVDSRGWRTVLVVSPEVRLSRARLYLRRCSRAEVAGAAVANPPGDTPGQVRHEITSFVDALLFDRAC